MSEHCHLIHSGFLLDSFFDPKRQLNFNGLHGAISKKTELFTTTAVKTSNPTSSLRFRLSGNHRIERCSFSCVSANTAVSLKMAPTMFADMFETLQHPTRCIPESSFECSRALGTGSDINLPSTPVFPKWTPSLSLRS